MKIDRVNCCYKILRDMNKFDSKRIWKRFNCKSSIWKFRRTKNTASENKFLVASYKLNGLQHIPMTNLLRIEFV